MKRKSKLLDLKHELASKIMCYLFIEHQSVKELASKIYGVKKENYRTGITKWLQRFSENGWIELETHFTREKFYRIKVNPFHWAIDINSNLDDNEKRYLNFLITEFIEKRIKNIGISKNLLNIYYETIDRAVNLSRIYDMFGFGSGFNKIVEEVKKVKKSKNYYIPQKIDKMNKSEYNKLKSGQGMFDLGFLFVSLLMPDSLKKKMPLAIFENFDMKIHHKQKQ